MNNYQDDSDIGGGTPLSLALQLPVKALNGGLFISRGRGGRHPERVIDSWELIFVDQGVLGMYEEDRKYDVEAGQSLLLRAHRHHGGTSEYEADLSFYWVHFSINRRQGPAAGPGVDVAAVDIPQVATVVERERLTSLYRRFLDDQVEGRAGSPIPDLLIMQMLCEVAASQSSLDHADGSARVLAQRVDKYLRTHAHEEISASKIAKSLDYHPDYLGRVYKSVYGIPMTRAINRFRLREAKQRLLQSGETIEAIARAIGFADVEYFRRVFRREEGMSPGAYRQLYARIHITTF